jgi:hypothetical protein
VCVCVRERERERERGRETDRQRDRESFIEFKEKLALVTLIEFDMVKGK